MCRDHKPVIFAIGQHLLERRRQREPSFDVDVVRIPSSKQSRFNPKSAQIQPYSPTELPL